MAWELYANGPDLSMSSTAHSLTKKNVNKMKSEQEIRDELQKLREFVAQVVDEELKQRHIHYIDQLEWVLKDSSELS